ncbi:hypothetical protein [Kitasatospora cineracea]|uniref:hypothetical protein n=1 Tax=Kitasatospora cineracea TaxID=88074 RepID=UPI0011CEBA13|nr:hypothetical protein [Kitasatospora cineracea]
MGSNQRQAESRRAVLSVAEQQRQRRNKIITVCVSAAVALGMVAAVAWFIASEAENLSHQANPASSRVGGAAAFDQGTASARPPRARPAVSASRVG